MPKISYKGFDGEIPKLAKHLLPAVNAQLATNCIFSDGTLRALKGGALLQSMANNPVKGIYTEDGLLFYTWAQETYAFKSPVLEDAFGRVYYLTPAVGEFRVALASGMAVGGPSPGTSWKVGVPKPTIAPALATVDRSTLPDYPGALISATAWWDYNGTKYSEGAVALTQVTAWRSYTFTPPAKPGSPPEGVTPVLVVRVQIKDSNNSNAILMDVVVRASSSATSNAFPGSVETALTVTTTQGRLDLTWGATEGRSYIYTNQNTWNEESAPSPPAVISPTYVQDVAVTVTASDFTGYRPFSKYVIYRTYGGNPTYVQTGLAGTGTTQTDTSRRPTSGIALLSTDYYPPVTGLEGIELMPGGWFVTFKDNYLYKHAPYLPHAVPYIETFPTSIRGVRSSQSGLVVTCADGVYVVSGVGPQQAGYMKMDAPQPGIAQRSMTSLDGAVAYASSDGLPLVVGSFASMDASQKLFTREKWRELYGDIIGDYSLRLSYHDGLLVASSNTQAKGFMLRLDENAGSYTRHVQRMDCTFQLPVNDALYYSVGSDVYQFNAGSALTFDWWGKEHAFTYAVSIGAGRIRCSGTVNVKIYADGALWQESNVTDGYFRIKPKRAHRWSVRLGGSGTVFELELAQSMQELRGV